MLDLERLKVGDFKIENSVTIEEIETNCNNEEWLRANVITLEQLLAKVPKINIPKKQIDKLYNGVKVQTDNEDGLYKLYCDGEFIGSGIVENRAVKRDIILKYL